MTWTDLKPYFDLLNDNEGVVGLATFLGALVVAWATGILDALRRKPKFRIEAIPGPTFYCVEETGERDDGLPIMRVSFAIYLKVSNVGSAASSISDVHLGYHWRIAGPSWQWIRFGLGWFWLDYSAVIHQDFQYDMGNDNVKVYPFLIQKSSITGQSAETFLEVGRTTNGVVYFEQSEAWGACQPRPDGKFTWVQVSIVDTFGKAHKKRLKIPYFELAEAKQYNPAFGETLKSLQAKSSESIPTAP